MAEGEQDWLTQQTVKLARQLNDVLADDRDYASRVAAAQRAVTWALALGFDVQTKAAAAGQLNLRKEIVVIRTQLAAFNPTPENFLQDWPAYRRDIERIWIEYCGLIARDERLRAISLMDELADGFRALPRQLGEVIGDAANDAGKAFSKHAMFTILLVIGGAVAWRYVK